MHADVDNYPRASALALEFPVLRDADGVAPFDPEKLAAWARRRSNATQQAAAFVLQVFNFDYAFRGLRFNPVHAMAVWDDEQRAVFQRWARAPWNL